MQALTWQHLQENCSDKSPGFCCKQRNSPCWQSSSQNTIIINKLWGNFFYWRLTWLFVIDAWKEWCQLYMHVMFTPISTSYITKNVMLSLTLLNWNFLPCMVGSLELAIRHSLENEGWPSHIVSQNLQDGVFFSFFLFFNLLLLFYFKFLAECKIGYLNLGKMYCHALLHAWRSSICMIMKVIFTPATANGYSQAARFPPCFFSRRWKDICSNK